jgi:hypothetical protein
MGEIIPDKEPKLPLSGGWKVAIVFFTVFLLIEVGTGGWNGPFVVLAAFTAFGWITWLFFSR